MQKKIMLALIISSSGVMSAQEGVTSIEAAAPAQALTSVAAPGEQAPIAQVPVEQPIPVSESVVQPEPVATPMEPVQATQSAQPSMQTTSPAPAVEPVSAQPAAEVPPAQPQTQVVEPQLFEQADIEIKGIDTVDVQEPKGNWLYKRIWWEKAERTYEKIKQLTDKLIDLRMDFFVKRNQIDRLLIEFYSDVGFKHGELSELMDYLTRQLEQQRTQEGSLDEKERDILATLNDEKKSIEQMQQGLQTLGKIDQAVEDALLKLIEQLNQAKFYEQQSWEIFKAINRELSDKKARELFYTMDTYWRNLNSINAYLSDAFAKYFEQLTQKLQQESDKIKTTVQALGEKGINLQAQSMAMRKECKMPAKDEEQKETEESTGFLASVWRIVTAPFRAIGSVFGGLYDWVTGLFGGSSEDIVVAKPSRRASE